MPEPPIVAAMNAPLRSAYETIRDLLADAARAEVKSRHSVGVVIAEVKRSRFKYGARAVLQLADALGTDVQTLYRCANVAEVWSLSEMTDLLARTSQQGQPLSFSHFVLLASVTTPQRRAALVEQAVSESLSVRRLASLVDRERGEGGASLLPVALDRVVRTSLLLTRQVDAARADLLGDLAAAPDVRVALEQALRATERLRSLLSEHATRLSGPAPAPQAARRRGMTRILPTSGKCAS